MPADFAIGPAKRRPSKKTSAAAAPKARRQPPSPNTGQARIPSFTSTAKKVSPGSFAAAGVRKRRAAEEKLPGPTIPVKRYPTIAGSRYTKAQRQEIVRGQTEAIRGYIKAGTPGSGDRANAVMEAVNTGDKETRTQLRKLVGATHTSQTSKDVARARRYYKGKLVKFFPSRENLAREGADLRLHPPINYVGEPERDKQGVVVGSLFSDFDGPTGPTRVIARGGDNPDAGKALGTTARQKRADKEYKDKGGLASTLGVAGVPGLGSLVKSTGEILDETTRPVHALASAVQELHRGGSTKDILNASLAGLKNERKTTFGDVLREGGATPAVATIGGFIGDVAFDPTTYLTLGASAPAKVLSTGAERAAQAARAAEVAGDARKAAKLWQQSQKLAERAATASTNRGIQVGVTGLGGRGALKTSGEGTAGLSRLLGTHQAAEHLVEGESPVARVFQAARQAVSPTARPRTVPPEVWERVRDIQRMARAEHNEGRRTAEDLGRAFQTAVRKAAKASGRTEDEINRAVVAAVEKAPKDPASANAIRDFLGVGMQPSKAAQKLSPAYQSARQEIEDVLAASRGMRDDARKAREAAEREYEDALQAAGVAQGRAEILSRSVGGSRAEASVLARMRRGDVLPAGSVAADRAVDRLWEAANRVDDTRQVEREAEAAYAAVKKDAKQGRKGLKNAREDMAHQEAAARIADLPAHSIEGLPPEVRPVAQHLQDTFGGMAEDERMAGVLKNVRQNYVFHQQPEALEPSLRSRVRGGTKARRSVAATARTMQGSVEEINTALKEMRGIDDFFSTNVPALVSSRAGKHFDSLAAKREQERLVLHEVARPVGKPSDLHGELGNDSLYRIDDTGIHALETKKGVPDVEKARADMRRGEQVVRMNRMIGQLYTHQTLAGQVARSEVGRYFDRVLSGLKTALTVLNVPAYELRNMTGDLYFAFQADTHAKDVLDAYRVMGVDTKLRRARRSLGATYDPKMKVDVGGGRSIPADRLLREAIEDGGIRTGYVGAEKFEILRGVEPASVRTKFSRIRPIDRLRSVGQFREDGTRLATYLGARRRGFTRAEAARWVNQHHIDYGDLTEFEQGVLRRVFPFYTFAARNTRQQLTKLATRPGKFATYQKAREELAKNAGLSADWEQSLPDYQQKAGGIPLTKDRIIFPGLPVTDLARIGAIASPRDQFDLTAQMLNPLVKAPVEYFSNHSFFFKGPIYQDEEHTDTSPYVAAPPWAKLLPKPAQEALGVRDIIDKKTGNSILGWSAKTDYWARQLPQSNFATQVLTDARGSHGQDNNDALLSQLTGVKFGRIDKGQNELSALYEQRSQLNMRKEQLSSIPGGRVRGKGANIQYTKEYRKVLDDLSAIEDRILRKKRKLKYSELVTPTTRKPSGAYGSGSGGSTYGSGGGGTIYGSGGSSKIYGAP